jgi:hypothetical protein
MSNMSTLNVLYMREGGSVLDRIHKATGINRKYLYQIATGRRTPSARIAARMMAADSRLSLEGLLLRNSAGSELKEAENA